MQQNYSIYLVLLNISGFTVNVIAEGNPFVDITY